MRIFYITDEAFEMNSAPATHIHEVCSSFTKLGHQVTVYKPTVADLPGAKNYDVLSLIAPVFVTSLFFQVQLFVVLFFRFSRPEIIYVRHNLYLITPVLIGRLFNIPVVLEVNGKLLEELEDGSPNIINRILISTGLFTWVEHLIMKFAKHIITVTAGISSYMQSKYKIPDSRITVIRNGVNTHLFQPQATGAARETLEMDSDQYIIGYIGSLYSWQGLLYAVEAMDIVKTNAPNTKLMIIGSGEDSEHLKALVKSKQLQDAVNIQPAVHFSQVATYINAFDVCLSIPTRKRSNATSPFKVYEYLACDKPVIHSDIPGIREEFGAALHYTTPESAHDLAQAIISLQSKESREMYSNRARTFMQDGHSWLDVSKKIEVVLNNLT